MATVKLSIPTLSPAQQAAKNAIIFLNSLNGQFAKRFNKAKLNDIELVEITKIVMYRLNLFKSDARALNEMFYILNTRANFNYANNNVLKVLHSWLTNIKAKHLTFDNNTDYINSAFYAKTVKPLFTYFLSNSQMSGHNNYLLARCIDNMSIFFDKILIHKFRAGGFDRCARLFDPANF